VAEVRQARAVRVEQPDAAPAAALGVDGDAGAAQRLDVAQHGAHRHPEPLGELRRGCGGAGLQEQDEGEQPVGSHAVDGTGGNMTKDVWYLRRHSNP
jgi:hypothetical protein